MGQVDRCVLCHKARALLTAVHCLPRDSGVFNQCVDIIDSLTCVIDSLTTLAFQDGEEGDAEPTQDRQTSTETRWSGSSGCIDYGTQWRR